MNYTQTFEEFSKTVSTTDLALYAGVGIVLWILFKDKLSPFQKLILDNLNKFKNNNTKIATSLISATPVVEDKDVFLDLVLSWKQTRDLALKSGCSQAVKAVDAMFPYLSPSACVNEEQK